MNAVLIRDARPTDVDAIVRMVGKLANHHRDMASLTSEVLARNVFCDWPWVYVIVGEIDGELVGYAALYRLIKLQFGRRGLDMHHLFTEERFRGCGVGRSIVDACKVKAGELSCSYLAVGTHPDNHKAQEFYISLGFTRENGHPPRFSMDIE